MSENPINKVPLEIWEKIAENIHSPKDINNLSSAVPAFKNVVYTTRVEWLCYQILPVLVTNIYSNSYDRFQNDFLNCRLVCKHWRFAVDNFLENNVLHYPASGDDVDWKLNRCHFGQIFYLTRTETIFRQTKISTMRKMLNEASDHPGNPIVGRYVYLAVPEKENREGVNLVERFVETFGQPIYFLKIHFSGKMYPTVLISILLGLLQRLPNLKGLAISNNPCDTTLNETDINLENLKRKLNQIRTNLVSPDACGAGLQKLETLNLEIEGLASNFVQQMIIEMFCPESLKSLTVVKFLNSEVTDLIFPNLLHLSLNINNNEQLVCVLNFHCPKLRKLDLGKVMFHELDYDLLCTVIQKFQGSINHLSLNLPDLLEPVSDENREKLIKFFTTPEQLQMPNIKSLSLFGCCPLSLKFMCGNDFRSLDQLNLYLEHEVEYERTDPDFLLFEETNPEIIDIIQCLACVWRGGCWSKKPDLYSSNIWNDFPKLKFILVDSYWEPLNLHRWTYRRNDLEIIIKV